jgi:hypothetical protein
MVHSMQNYATDAVYTLPRARCILGLQRRAHRNERMIHRITVSRKQRKVGNECVRSELW